MPTYEYRCNACKHEFEQFQSMKDKPLRTCPACKKAKLERLIGTGGAIIFKGSGFYQTDYRSEGYKKAADADKPADKSGENKPAETKAESKTEAKPAPAK
jgi:putative FmdB family regulatory protein